MNAASFQRGCRDMSSGDQFSIANETWGRSLRSC